MMGVHKIKGDCYPTHVHPLPFYLTYLGKIILYTELLCYRGEIGMHNFVTFYSNHCNLPIRLALVRSIWSAVSTARLSSTRDMGIQEQGQGKGLRDN